MGPGHLGMRAAVPSVCLGDAEVPRERKAKTDGCHQPHGAGVPCRRAPQAGKWSPLLPRGHSPLDGGHIRTLFLKTRILWFLLCIMQDPLSSLEVISLPVPLNSWFPKTLILQMDLGFCGPPPEGFMKLRWAIL